MCIPCHVEPLCMSSMQSLAEVPIWTTSTLLEDHYRDPEDTSFKTHSFRSAIYSTSVSSTPTQKTHTPMLAHENGAPLVKKHPKHFSEELEGAIGYSLVIFLPAHRQHQCGGMLALATCTSYSTRSEGCEHCKPEGQSESVEPLGCRGPLRRT